MVVDGRRSFGYDCDGCQASYTTPVNLRAHKAAKHPTPLSTFSNRELLQELEQRALTREPLALSLKTKREWGHLLTDAQHLIRCVGSEVLGHRPVD